MSSDRPTSSATVNLVKFLSWFLGQAYIQCAAVLGALSLGSLFSEFITWQGLILELINWWAVTARPVVSYIFEPLVLLVNSLFKLELAFPDALKDYLAVGIVLFLSRWRGATGGWEGGVRSASKKIIRHPFAALALLVRTVFIWPFEVIVLLRNFIFAEHIFQDRTTKEIKMIRASHLISLLPVFYAVILVALNWIVAFFPDFIHQARYQVSLLLRKP